MTELDKTANTETHDDNEKLAGEIADKLVDNKTFKEACDSDVTQVDDPHIYKGVAKHLYRISHDSVLLSLLMSLGFTKLDETDKFTLVSHQVGKLMNACLPTVLNSLGISDTENWLKKDLLLRPHLNTQLAIKLNEDLSKRWLPKVNELGCFFDEEGNLYCPNENASL